jgi:hypothetical protein
MIEMRTEEGMALIDSLRGASRVALMLGAVGLIGACDSAKRDDSGRIVDSGDLDVFTMQVGDCFQDTEDEVVADVKAVPCAQAHDNEVYHLFALKGETWPGDVEVEQTAEEGCLPAFETYVGSAYEESRLDYSWLTPTQRSWEEKDDRDIVCILYDGNLDRLMGSMKGARE